MQRVHTTYEALDPNRQWNSFNQFLSKSTTKTMFTIFMCLIYQFI